MQLSPERAEYEFYVYGSTSSVDPSYYGNENNNLLNLQLFPNPSSGKATLKLGKTYRNISISVTNVLGQECLKMNFKNTDEIKINLTDPKGIYLIMVSTPDEKKGSIKFIKTQ